MPTPKEIKKRIAAMPSVEQNGRRVVVIGAKVRKPPPKTCTALGIVKFSRGQEIDSGRKRVIFTFISPKRAREFFVQEFGRETPKWIEDHPRLKWESSLFNVR